MWTAADSLDWNADGRDWPNREFSRHVDAAGLTWHVQRMGAGPPLLLIHGTGGSTHSWRDLAPLLAQSFDVLAFELPGHGFTSYPECEGLTLPGMARGAAELAKTLGFSPRLIVGHSAGAAIAARMSLDGLASPDMIVSLNGALLPFPGIGRHLLPTLAKVLYTNSIVPRLMAWRGRDSNTVARLLEGMGSNIDAKGLELYQRLFTKPAHVSATLNMMAGWDLVSLERDLPRLRSRFVVVVSALDRAIPPDEGLNAAARVPGAITRYIRNAGHLAHEERPREIAELIIADAREAGLLAAPEAQRGTG